MPYNWTFFKQYGPRSPTNVNQNNTQLQPTLPHPCICILPITSYVFPHLHAATMAKFPTASSSQAWCFTAKSYSAPKTCPRAMVFWSGCVLQLHFLVHEQGGILLTCIQIWWARLSNVDQLTGSWMSVKNLSSWPHIERGTADLIIQYPKRRYGIG